MCPGDDSVVLDIVLPPQTPLTLPPGISISVGISSETARRLTTVTNNCSADICEASNLFESFHWHEEGLYCLSADRANASKLHYYYTHPAGMENAVHFFSKQTSRYLPPPGHFIVVKRDCQFAVSRYTPVGFPGLSALKRFPVIFGSDRNHDATSPNTSKSSLSVFLISP